MEIQIEKMEAFRLLGKVEKQFVKNVRADEFWKCCNQDGTLEELIDYSTSQNKELIGLADGSSYDGASYQYYIATPFDGEEIPEGYVIKTIPRSTWLKVQSPDADGFIDQEIWSKIYSEFFPTTTYEPAEYQLEVYPNGDMKKESEVWIAVQKRGK